MWDQSRRNIKLDQAEFIDNGLTKQIAIESIRSEGQE